VIDYDHDSGRWKVCTADGTGKRLKAENMEALTGLPNEERFRRLHSGREQCGGGSAFAPGQQVRVVGLTERTELNGQSGTLVEFGSQQGRWKVLMSDGSRKTFREANMERVHGEAPLGQTPALPSPNAGFHPGQHVVLMNLKSKPEHNGKEGIVIQFEASENRWKVLLRDGGQGVLLRSANMQVIQTGVADSVLGSCAPLPAGDGCPPRGSTGNALAQRANGALLSGEAGTRELPRHEAALASAGSLLGPSQFMGSAVRVEAGGYCATGATEQDVVTDVPEPDAEPAAPCVAARPSDGDAPAFMPGQAVRVVSFGSITRFSGHLGTVVSFHDSVGKWRVNLANGITKTFPTENLEPLQLPSDPTGGLPLAIPAVSTQTSASGSTTPATDAIVAAPIRACAETSSTPGNLPFSPGQHVRVVGMSRRLELNGQEGNVVGFDEEDRRWRVRMFDGSGKRFSTPNLMAVPRGQGASRAPDSSSPVATVLDVATSGAPSHCGQVSPQQCSGTLPATTSGSAQQAAGGMLAVADFMAQAPAKPASPSDAPPDRINDESLECFRRQVVIPAPTSRAFNAVGPEMLLSSLQGAPQGNCSGIGPGGHTELQGGALLRVHGAAPHQNTPEAGFAQGAVPPQASRPRQPALRGPPAAGRTQCPEQPRPTPQAQLQLQDRGPV